MEVVRATESVTYRIALWYCFGNRIPTLQQSDWLARSGGAPKQSRDAIRHKADPVSRTTSTKTKKALNLSVNLIGTKVLIEKLLFYVSYWGRDVIRARRRFSCFQG